MNHGLVIVLCTPLALVCYHAQPMSAAAQAIADYWDSHVDEAREKQAIFLAALRESGTVLHAAQAAAINRNTAYLWRQNDPVFRAEWDEALEDTTDKVERSLFNMATSEKNVVATIFYLKGNRAKYRDRLAIDVNQVDREIEERLRQLPAATTDGLVDSDSNSCSNSCNSPSNTSSVKAIIGDAIR